MTTITIRYKEPYWQFTNNNVHRPVYGEIVYIQIFKDVLDYNLGGGPTSYPYIKTKEAIYFFAKETILSIRIDNENKN